LILSAWKVKTDRRMKGSLKLSMPRCWGKNKLQTCSILTDCMEVKSAIEVCKECYRCIDASCLDFPNIRPTTLKNLDTRRWNLIG